MRKFQVATETLTDMLVYARTTQVAVETLSSVAGAAIPGNAIVIGRSISLDPKSGSVGTITILIPG